jgi:hypothetical protein
MSQTQIGNSKSEELDLQDLLEEDVKAGDIIGIAIDEGTDKKSEIKWDFYFIVDVQDEVITICKAATGSSTTTLNELAKTHADAFYLHIPMVKGRLTWTPGNRNLNDITVETVLVECFQLSHKEEGWTTRSVESLSEETGLQAGRIRKALQRDNRFKETDRGNWTLVSLSNKKPASTAPVREARRRGNR